MVKSLRRLFRPSLLALLALLCSAAASGEEPHIQVGVSQAGEVFTVEATIDAPVTQKTAWDVLVDFDHMASIVHNLTLSKVVSRQENILVVKQEGVARYGLLSFSYQSEREVHLEPMKRIQSKNLSGSAKRMESDMQISPANPGQGVQIAGVPIQGVQIKYRAEIVPDSVLARMFGASYLKQQVEEQFRSMVAEMQKREPYRAAVAAVQAQKTSD